MPTTVSGARRFLRRLPVILGLALGLLTPAADAAARTPGDARLTDPRPAHQLWGTVVEIKPGPELVVQGPDRRRLGVRLIGIELPEPPRGNGSPAAGQPFGQEAKAYLEALLLQKQVLLEPHGRDPRGCVLAVVHLGEINVNLTLVKEGLAWVSPRDTAPQVRAPLEVAERQAQVARYGLWSLPDPEPPWTFRKRRGLAKE
jgi:endonuclease YncB( thermonuclease family)